MTCARYSSGGRDPQKFVIESFEVCPKTKTERKKRNEKETIHDGLEDMLAMR